MYLQNNARLLDNVIWFFIFFTLGMIIAVSQSVGFDLSVMPGTLGDGRLNNYILEHGYQYLWKDGFSYWSAPFFFPEKNAISYSENLFGVLPLYTVCRFWADRETAYQLWCLILIALNFIGAYYALKKMNATIYASSVGAFIYAFSPIILIQIGHIQLLPRFFAPFAIVGFYLWLQSNKNKYFYVSVCLLTYQFYCSIYLGYFLMYVLMAMLGVYLIQKRSIAILLKLFDTKKTAWLTSAVLFSMLCLLGILFYPYYLRSVDGNGYPAMEILEQHTPKLWTHILASRRSVSWGWTHDTIFNTFVLSDASKGEGYIFIGALPHILFIASVLLYRKSLSMRYFIITTLVIFIVILSVYGFSLYTYLVHLIPGAQAIRFISRYIIIAVFLWSIIAAFFLDRFLWNQRVYTKVLIFLIPVLLVLDNVHYKSQNQVLKSDSQQRSKLIVDMYREKSHKQPKVKAFALHFNTDSIRKPILRSLAARINHLDAMMASQVIGVPCINGYSGNVPPDYGAYEFSPDKEKLDAWLHSNRLKTTVKETYDLQDILILER